MLTKAIDRILQLAAPFVMEINGEQYTNCDDLYRIPEELLAKPLAVHTLSAIVDYIENDTDGGSRLGDGDRRFVIHVEDYSHVKLYRELNDDKKRECLLDAGISVPSFPFGRWLDLESFIINVQTHFVKTETRDALIKLAGQVTTDSGVTLSDDGITQKVAARSGISLVKNTEVPNPVTLAPFRTFPEVEQPESPFVFRVRKNDDAIEAALFEADGDGWERDTILAIRRWLELEIKYGLDKDVVILA